MNEPKDELSLLDEEPGSFQFFAWKNVTIMVWLATPEVAHIERLVRMGDARIASVGGGKLSDIHLVTRGVGLPDADVRSALLTASRTGSPHLAAVGVWLAGSGFWASAVRSLVTGMNVVLREPFELRMFAELEALSEWLPGVHESVTGVPITAPRLLGMLRRAQLQAEQHAHE